MTLIKCEITGVPNEHWWALMNEGRKPICRIPMSAEQARMFMRANPDVKLISAAQYWAPKQGE